MNANLHKLALDEVTAKIALLQAQITALEPVVAYHQAALGVAPPQSNGHSAKIEEAKKVDELRADDLKGLKMHEAVKLVLEFLDRPSSTSEIVQMLRGLNYRADQDQRILFNSTFTALKRKPEVFAQVEKGWTFKKLLSQK